MDFQPVVQHVYVALHRIGLTLIYCARQLLSSLVGIVKQLIQTAPHQRWVYSDEGSRCCLQPISLRDDGLLSVNTSVHFLIGLAGNKVPRTRPPGGRLSL